MRQSQLQKFLASGAILLDKHRSPFLADFDEANGLLAQRALSDERFKRVVSYLEMDKVLGDFAPRMSGGTAWRDYVPSCEYMVAAQSPVAGTAEALVNPAPYSFIPQGFLQSGKILHFDIWGKLATAGSTPGGLTLTARYGTTTGGTSLGASAASPTFATSRTNDTWHAELRLQCYTPGTAGSVQLFGRFETVPGTFTTTAGMLAGLLIPASAAAPVTVDTTTSQGLILDVTLGSASDNMTPLSFSFEAVN